MNILEGLFAEFLETSSITELIGTGDDCRAFPLKADQECTRPYVIFRTVASVVTHAMNSDPTLEYTLIQIEAWADSLSDAYEVGEAVQALLTDFAGELGGAGGVAVQRIFRESRLMEDFDPEAREGMFVVRQDFGAWFVES